MNLSPPPLLKSGDHVGVVSPANNVDPDLFGSGIEVLRSWGLNVVVGANALANHHRFAGNDLQRAEDLQQMLDSDRIRAIFCSRGGYGTTRIIDSLDFSKLVRYPKWVIGFSDITALLVHVNRLNIQSLHAVVPILFTNREYQESVEKLKTFLFSGIAEMQSIQKQPKQGVVSAPIVGGNLSILCHVIGTSSDFDTEGKILFLEEVDEYGYRIDRMMVQLKRSGKLKGAKAVVLGHFTDVKEPESLGKTADEIVMDHLTELEIPIGRGLPIGHEAPNFPVPLGRMATLTVLENEASLSFT